VDEEYLSAANDYKKTASKIHEATEFFKKRVIKMIETKAIAGKTATNMGLLLSEMSSALRSTFKEQISFEALLCDEYVRKINEADKSMSFNSSTKSVQSMPFSEAAGVPYKEGLIILNKDAIEECISQLKEGPIKDIQDYLEFVKRISFNESEGDVKDQNMLVRDKALTSIKALFELFQAFITTFENATAAMQDTDELITQSMVSGKGGSTG
jgi:hypothetical protein